MSNAEPFELDLGFGDFARELRVLGLRTEDVVMSHADALERFAREILELIRRQTDEQDAEAIPSIASVAYRMLSVAESARARARSE